MKITCVSDLHGYQPKLPGGDLLIVAGDLTVSDWVTQYHDFADWIKKQPYKKKIFIAGNHDGCIERGEFVFKEEDIDAVYLCDEAYEFEGLKIWGSPWTSWFHGVNPNCKAFMIKGSKLNSKWKKIPDNIDILITHSPPYGIFDSVGNREVGCPDLRYHVFGRIKPKLHIFGHIHEQGGKTIDLITTKFVNASVVNEHYDLIHPIINIEL